MESHKYHQMLLSKCKLAMAAAIELYNKPLFGYREESCTILLTNAWDLAIKALLAKSNVSFFASTRDQPPSIRKFWSRIAVGGEQAAISPSSRRPHTLPLLRALEVATTTPEENPCWPTTIPAEPVMLNLELISRYRDDAIHYFVDSEELASVLYCLAQASVMNFRDLLRDGLDADLEREFSWHIAPLRLSPPPIPIKHQGNQIFPNGHDLSSPTSAAFIADLRKAIDKINRSNGDVDRLLTRYVHDAPEPDRP